MTFTEKPEPQKTGKLQVNSRFRPGADENDKWRSIVMNNGSQSFQFEVNILNGLTVDLPIGTYEVSCNGASILTRITIQQGTTTTVSLVAY